MFRARTAGPASAADVDAGPLSVSRRQRRRAATGAGALGRGAGLLARVLQFVVSVVVLIIVAGILLVVLKANPTSIVSEVHGWARSLAGPFDGMFGFHSANTAIAVNWGIAAVVYLFAGVLIARLIGGTPLAPTRVLVAHPIQEDS